MPSSTVSRRATLVALAVAAAALGGAAAGSAVAAAGADTTLAVSPRVLLRAPERSPVDFPGVARARAGEPLPRGYVVVARAVRITRGGEVAAAALRMSCPRGTTWRTGAELGELAVSVLDRVVSGKRSVLVMANLDTGTTAVGRSAAGTVYALCR